MGVGLGLSECCGLVCGCGCGMMGVGDGGVYLTWGGVGWVFGLGVLGPVVSYPRMG